MSIDISGWNIQALRVQERKRIPVVLTKEEVKLVMENLRDGFGAVYMPFALEKKYKKSKF